MQHHMTLLQDPMHLREEVIVAYSPVQKQARCWTGRPQIRTVSSDAVYKVTTVKWISDHSRYEIVLQNWTALTF
jgi:hypothetical protein